VSRSTAPNSQRTGALTYAVLLTAATITAVPFVWLTCAAFKTNEDFFSSTFLPHGEGAMGIGWSRLTLDNFRHLMEDGLMGRALLNSVFLSSVTAVLATLFCAMGGYALAKFKFRGQGAVLALVLSALIVPPTLLLAPGYQLLFHFGLLDSFAGVILPAMAPAFGVFLFRQASLTGVPGQLLEAARMDGCGEIRTFFTIALPLLRPMSAAFMLITFLGVWNNFIVPQVVMQSPGKFPLSVAVSQLKGIYYQDYGLQMAGTLLSVAPVLLLFLLLQRAFIAGLTSGAVKG
jgi:ABC-type glycerol-3-phosphate transport system permease component